jgi:hypothetical protein
MTRTFALLVALFVAVLVPDAARAASTKCPGKRIFSQKMTPNPENGISLGVMDIYWRASTQKTCVILRRTSNAGGRQISMGIALYRCVSSSPRKRCGESMQLRGTYFQEYVHKGTRRSLPVSLKTGRDCIRVQGTMQTYEDPGRGGYAITSAPGKGRFCHGAKTTATAAAVTADSSDLKDRAR